MPKPARTQRRAKPQLRGDSGVLERLRDHLERLGLKELDKHLDAHLAWAHDHTPSALVLLERVFGDGAQQLRQRRVERRIETCGLRVRKTLETFDWAFQKNLNRAITKLLLECPRGIREIATVAVCTGMRLDELLEGTPQRAAVDLHGSFLGAQGSADCGEHRGPDEDRGVVRVQVLMPTGPAHLLSRDVGRISIRRFAADAGQPRRRAGTGVGLSR